jgi:hypothetical protein
MTEPSELPHIRDAVADDFEARGVGHPEWRDKIRSGANDDHIYMRSAIAVWRARESIEAACLRSREEVSDE